MKKNGKIFNNIGDLYIGSFDDKKRRDSKKGELILKNWERYANSFKNN